MSDVLPYDPTNRKLWDAGMLQTIGWWWLWGIAALFMLWQLINGVVIELPISYQEKVAHDSFIANTVTTDAKVIRCMNWLGGRTRFINFEFVPSGGTMIEGSGAYEGDCADFPTGKIVQVRYLPNNPSQYEGVDEFNYADSAFYHDLRMIPLHLLNVLLMGWHCVNGLILSAKGRVRIGRIVSARGLTFSTRIVRYTVTADDGTVRKGWRVMSYENITPELVAGAPIPVLYANKWVHLPFGLRPPREPRPTKAVP